MKKVIPFNNANQGKSGPPAPQPASDSAARDDALDWQIGSEHQLLLLLQRLIGCSDSHELMCRFFRWTEDMSLADGLTFNQAGESTPLVLGLRRNNSAQYDLNIDNTSLGNVVICRRKRYNEGELANIEQALGALARCLLVAQEMQALKARATLDSLTGLGNRNSLNIWMKTEISRARRHSSPLALLMVDVDNFKTINDRFGHLGGDQVLKAIAEVFQRSTRGSDLRFRFGGDEFAILLPHTDIQGAENAAAQIRDNLARLSPEELGIEPSKDSPRPDISVGVAAYEPGDSELTLMLRADTHLYHAKALGRGRVCSRL